MIDRFFSSDPRSRIAALFCFSLVACQPGARPSSTGSTQPDPVREDPRSHVVAITSTEDEDEQPPETKTNEPAADEDPLLPTRVGSKPRSRALLVTELQGLEQLASVTPPTAPDRPQILRRIAEDFVELEHAAKNEGNTSMQIAARNKAISTYAELVQEHPNVPQLDEAIYYLAVEYEHASDFMRARQTYLALIQKMPASRFVPNAYLAFGEMFFDEAAQDPTKWDLALSAYQRVLRDPPPRNNVYGYAWYKVAWVLRNKGDVDGARDAFNHAIAYATEYWSAPGSAKLAEASRNDLRTL